MPNTPDARAVIADNLAAYNARDLARFMASFADDVEVWDQQANMPLLRGREQVQLAYGELFANSPHLHSHIVHRAAVGTVVIDHEMVTGRQGGDLEILISYQVREGCIARVWVSRAPLAQPPSVRQAGSADVEVVASIGRETYIEHFAHIWSTAGLQAHVAREFAVETIVDELASDRVTYFLAEAAGQVIGFAKLRHPRATSLQPVLIGAELQKIYLRSGLERRGSGVLLLDACLAQARRLGLPLLWLDVLERNVLATCFYLRHGFQFHGKETFQTDLGPEVMLVLQRPL